MDEIKNGVFHTNDPEGTSKNEILCEREMLPKLPMPENGEEIPDGEKISTNAEDAALVDLQRRKKAVLLFSRLISGILAIVGLASYSGLGYMGIRYLKNGGFKEIAASSVFGGAIDRILPQKGNKDEVERVEDDGDKTDSANAENVLIKAEDIGCAEYSEVFNETSYDPGEVTVPASLAVPKYRTDSAVLIIHTHGTEAYAPDTETVSADESFRTSDKRKSVVAVGSAFAEILEKRGISTYHCTEMFDKESYIDAYTRSAAAVREYIEKYPEISYVLDIHRDAVIRADGTVIKSDSGDGAQLMIVCGTDEMGADFSDWQENFAFGTKYQKMLFERSPRSVRHMNLRSASFNQQLAKRYLLLEVGSCGNTLDEAILCAKNAASVFADLIMGRES